METIHDVFAVIRGLEEPDRYVLLGNHRDAWTYGAVDPNSGTAALLDIARRFALMMRLGWTPRRTIVLCSWDAEEFGMVGNSPSSLAKYVVRQETEDSFGKFCHQKCLFHQILFCLLRSNCDFYLMFSCVKIGSTEWVEQNLVNLGSKAVAYLNVDCAVQGPGFFAGATPQLDNLILEVIKKVNLKEGNTILHHWSN